ncbi:DEAD/DEAH box helicase [Myroides sp. LJL116]
MFGKPTEDWYFNALVDIYDRYLQQNQIKQSYIELLGLLERFSKQVVAKETIVFSNLLSRLNFIINTYQTSNVIHELRWIEKDIKAISDLELADYFITYWSDVALFIQQVYRVPLPFIVQNRIENNPLRYRKPTITFQRSLNHLKVVFDHKKADVLYCYAIEGSSKDYLVVHLPTDSFGIPVFTTDSFWQGALLYLIDVGVDTSGHLHAKLVVLEPDYLIDVSSIAECFQDYGQSALHFLKNKLQLPSNTMYLLLGNFANLVIDQVIGQSSLETVIGFEELFHKHFLNYPTEHLFCEDISTYDGFMNYQGLCQMHYTTIVKVVTKDFSYYGLNNREAINLEPSFLSNIYGIQGRLDVLHQNDSSTGKSVIVELKSGSVPYPDKMTNVKENHSSQLYMYFLMLSQIKGISLSELTKGQSIDGFIFYSKVSKGNLRSDHISISKIQSICQMRNDILVNEHILQSGQVNKIIGLIRNIHGDHLIKNNINTKFKAILEKQFEELTTPIFKSSPLVQSYFWSYLSFIAKEQYWSKCAGSKADSSTSLAGMWNRSFEQKVDSFGIMYNLKITHNLVNTAKKAIVFEIQSSSELSSFRVGDVCVLYPFVDKEHNPTNYQIFKCTIVSISLIRVEVELRFQQNNLQYFDKYSQWALERDFMDSSFSGMYQNLYRFVIANTQKQALLLTTRKPLRGENYGYVNHYLSIEQNRILNNMLSCEDYFVLNGPPGTGKTSHIIKEFVREVHKGSKANILVLAYTNRAVDELSEAVLEALQPMDLPKGKEFIRLGNTLSCKKQYQDYLLSSIVDKSQRDKHLTRANLSSILKEQRVFLSTVSSITSKEDLLKFKAFDWVLIDEASQILEPQIIGLLAHCKKFILIGDHKQLPAIVLQDAEQSKSNNTMLEGIGLFNRRNSLFERLYHFCKDNTLDYAYDTLTYQGRMHQEISDFPNRLFYEGKLQVAYSLPNLSASVKKDLYRQVADLPYTTKERHWCSVALARHRVLFIDVPIKEQDLEKTAQGEADMVVEVILRLIGLYKENNVELDLTKKIGVIAPFKNQIALIYRKLQQANVANANQITIDTVERFQGGQRDIILYTFSAVNSQQLEALINLNDSLDVDRKLNVALTRAKEQLILIGNASIVEQDPLYGKLLEDMRSKDSFYTAL